MSEQKKPDDLTKTTEPESIDLTEEELGRVSGGTVTGTGTVKVTDKINSPLNKHY